jgi:hypothetical protein
LEDWLQVTAATPLVSVLTSETVTIRLDENPERSSPMRRRLESPQTKPLRTMCPSKMKF